MPDEVPSELTAELFSRQVKINGGSIQISRVADNLNAVLLRYGKPATSGAKLNSLLLEAGYLETVDAAPSSPQPKAGKWGKRLCSGIREGRLPAVPVWRSRATGLR